MPKISKEESLARRNEIIDACEALYRSESYHDITMTQVAERVSFGRANVYNYFQCKDEILLALLQREHELWTADLAAIASRAGDLSDDELADDLAKSVQAREQMLKLLAMNLYDMEQNSRLENLIQFKHAYKLTVDTLKEVLEAAKPQWREDRLDLFVFAFLPFLHGVYPYVYHTEKQTAAMEKAGVTQPELTTYSTTKALALKLLQDEPIVR